LIALKSFYGFFEIGSNMNKFKTDMKRLFRNNKTYYSKIKIFLITQGAWAITIYRAGSWCHKNKKNFFIRVIMPFLTIIQKFVEILTGIVLPFTTEIGKGLFISHFGNIIISHKVIIGDYCNISHEVTIGQSGRGGEQKTPIIGDRVYIGPGAKIFGDIKIGNNVAIGANAVVNKDLPDNAVAVGVPAIIKSYKGSKDFVVI
jgi:serine O-acetyltransferase